MPTPPPTGRFEKRTARSVAVELSRMDASLLKESTLTENVSPRGIRVATEHEWKPGEPVLVMSMREAVWCQARVVYCRPLEKGGFAVGLKLFTRVEQWARPP
ncbi:MAG: hypothetical protein DMG35_10535 [Acidobacteria bacterium]|nr:MAG: hypothetical protein DMG35_10535 [Acidobacteriota bacterium]